MSRAAIPADSNTIIVLRGIYAAYAVFFLAYMGAYISAPDDLLFFYAVGSRFSCGWMMVILCTAAEVFCLTSAIASCLLTTYSGFSYIYTMRFLSQ